MIKINVDPNKISQPVDLIPALKKNKYLINKLLNLKTMEPQSLIHMANFMMIDVITGTHIFNEIYKHTVNSPRYALNLVLFMIRSQHRIVWEHWLF
jgi:hypothetical protein